MVFRRSRPKNPEVPPLPYEIVYRILSHLSLVDVWSARVINRLFHQTSLDVISAKYIKNSAIIMILPRLSQTYSHTKPFELRPVDSGEQKMVSWSSPVSRTDMVEIVFYHELHPGSPTLINRIQFCIEGRVYSHQFRAAFVYGGDITQVGFLRGRDAQVKLYDELLSRPCRGSFRTLFKKGISLPGRKAQKRGYFEWDGEVCEVCLPLWDVIRIVKLDHS